MNIPLLTTKLNIPPRRPNLVARPHLMEQLNEGLHPGNKLTLVSAPAGFGKTTLVREWMAGCGKAVAWLSLDDADGEPARFLAYLIAALQTVAPGVGESVSGSLQSPQPPAIESVLISLLNEVAAIPDDAIPNGIVLVLDDYHATDSPAADKALTFLLEHLPAQMHLVIATREDPRLALARLRARGQMTELRAADLRFTANEAAAFLNRAMGLNLSSQEIVALERRTEGWIAGLQMAALALKGNFSTQGHEDPAGFISSFSGSHRFVLDYLLEEVLEQQPASIRSFLLNTSILDRLCGPLCDAVCTDGAAVCFGPTETDERTGASGQEMLEYLEQANLFLAPLDGERRWYRYHHLFRDLLQQRLHQRTVSSPADDASSTAHPEPSVAELHSRASVWYEDNGLDVEAFRHAAAANDIGRAARLVNGKGMPLHFRGAVTTVLNWLSSLPTTVLDARPSLWVTYASALTMVGYPVISIEEKLHAAEAAMAKTEADAAALGGPARQAAEPDDRTQDLVGQIAAIRAMLAVPKNQVKKVISQSHLALESLHPDNLPLRTAAAWALGYAYQLQGDRGAAGQAYSEVLSISQASGNIIFEIAAATGLGQLQESENQLHLASETYQRVLQLAGDPPLPIACGAHLGLTHIFYEWNDLEAAEQHGQECLRLARLLENNDAPATCLVSLARLKLARGDVAGAVALLAEAEQFARQNDFVHLLPDVAAARVVALLRHGPLLHQDNLAAAAELAEKHDLPTSTARIHLAQGEPAAALAILERLRRQLEARGCADEQLKVMVLQAMALQAQGKTGEAVQALDAALALAEPGGFIRLFVDEGPPMTALLSKGVKHGVAPTYLRRLQAALAKEEGETTVTQRLLEPLTDREREVLSWLGSELNGPAIARELMVSLNTMRSHTKNIYSKLGVNNRRAAVRRAKELDLL